MLPKYTVEYSTVVRDYAPRNHYGTDDPVACEEFITELLDRGCRLHTIKHDGVELSRTEFDRMVKSAAGMTAAKRLCATLGIKPEEEKYRFGYSL